MRRVAVNDAAQRQVWRAWLSSRERARHDKLAGEDADAYLAAHALAREMLGRALGLAPEAVDIVSGAHGRPEVVGTAVSLRFSLAHTRGAVACAVAHDADVGVDVEPLTRVVNLERMVPRVCSAAERAALAALPDEQRSERFLALWTLKEACSKALGLGIGAGLSRIDVAWTDEMPRVQFAAPLREQDAHWWLQQHRLDDAHLVALAVRAEETPEIERVDAGD
jgi:4'-phosphopantetheinyl transferase